MFWILLLKSRISLTIPDISFSFLFFISSLDIYSILFFKLLHLFLISSTNLLFSFASFISNNFFAKTPGTKSKSFWNESLFMFFKSLSIKAMLLLMSSSISSSFFYFSSFILDSLSLYGNSFLWKALIISFLKYKNFLADSKTLFFSSFFCFSWILVF